MRNVSVIFKNYLAAFLWALDFYCFWIWILTPLFKNIPTPNYLCFLAGTFLITSFRGIGEYGLGKMDLVISSGKDSYWRIIIKYGLLIGFIWCCSLTI